MKRRHFIAALPLTTFANATLVIPSESQWQVLATPSRYQESDPKPLGNWQFKAKYVTSPVMGIGSTVTIMMSCEAWLTGDYYGTVTKANLTLRGSIKDPKTGELSATLSPNGKQTTVWSRITDSTIARTVESMQATAYFRITRQGSHSAIGYGSVSITLNKWIYMRNISGGYDLSPQVSGYPMSNMISLSARVDSILQPSPI